MPKQKLARISITVPEKTVDALDQKIVDQHYESRSQAIVDMINKHLIADQEQRNEVMVGTFTLLYDASSTALRIGLLDLQQQFLEQVVSSLHIQLDDHKILEVMILQGVSSELKVISQHFSALKGVIKRTFGVDGRCDAANSAKCKELRSFKMGQLYRSQGHKDQITNKQQAHATAANHRPNRAKRNARISQ